MKVLNLNIHFYPESLGGAAVVAEKFGHAASEAGHEVTNVYLSQAIGTADFHVTETPFGRSIGIKNLPVTPANRFNSPAATSLLFEIYDLVQPDRVFVHAVQHMGALDFLSDPKVLARTTIVAHDFYWTCLQGFRTLPDGKPCNLSPSPRNCGQCAWFPGLTERTYATMRSILSGSRAIVFPSAYLHNSYVELLNEELTNFHVQSNPDTASMLFQDTRELPTPAAEAAVEAGKTVFGFVGGPGETKGWGLVQAIMARAAKVADVTGGPHVVLFDIGRNMNQPWYGGISTPGTSVVDPFHWSYAAHALKNVDVMLMPSRVRESFGLAAREMLSLGGASIIRPSGALSEMMGHRGVLTAGPEDTVDDLLDLLPDCRKQSLPLWPQTSDAEYCDRLLAL